MRKETTSTVRVNDGILCTTFYKKRFVRFKLRTLRKFSRLRDAHEVRGLRGEGDIRGCPCVFVNAILLARGPGIVTAATPMPLSGGTHLSSINEQRAKNGTGTLGGRGILYNILIFDTSKTLIHISRYLNDQRAAR